MIRFSGRGDAPRMHSIGLPLVASFALALGGCVHMPKTGVKATGEPLAVDIRTEHHEYVGKARVGEVVNKDASGRVVGTSEVYEDRMMAYNVTRWQVFQGDSPIDDEDFWRIAGDTESAEKIKAMRERGVTTNHVGLGLLLGGLAAVGASLALRPALTETDPTTGIDTTPAWPMYMMTGGLITASVGGVMMFMGSAAVKRQHPIDDPILARRTAKKYNKTLGAGGGDEEEEEEPPRKKKKRHADEDEE